MNVWCVNSIKYEYEYDWVWVLIVYSWMEHVTWKSPGPMCGSVGRILRPDSCTTVSSWSKVPLLSIWSVAVPLCRPLLPCSSRWHGSLPRHGLWWLICELHCSPLPGGSGLCTSCERVHFFLVFLDPQTKLPACLSNIRPGAVLARLHRVVNSQQDVIKMSDGHRHVVIR